MAKATHNCTVTKDGNGLWIVSWGGKVRGKFETKPEAEKFAVAFSATRLGKGEAEENGD